MAVAPLHFSREQTENKLLVSGVSVFPEKQQNRFLKFAEFLKYNDN